uniref:Uncharacterized protein n=1 Tax=Caenorhabditis japonica TaxID=281687 RepID=A0A8R1HMW3_CAEJA
MPPLENLVTDDRNTLQFPMATFTNSASLGEMLFELSALFGISRKLGRVPILNQLKDEGIDVRWNLEIRRDFPLFAEQFEGIDVETILTLGSSSVDDFAFSRKFCDVVLLSAPTSASGWWMAYLAKDGAEVFYRYVIF